MFRFIKKRDNQVLKFESDKITNAILKAGKASGEFGREIAEKLTVRVLDVAQLTIKSEVPSVEKIQDIVEEFLINSPYKKTAKSFILYRDQHAKIREIVSNAEIDLIDKYLEKLDWQVKENSNMSYSLQGLNN